MELGGISIFGLQEGLYEVAGDKRFQPVQEGAPRRPGALRVTVRPFLVIAPGHITLLDTGLGGWGSEGWGELYANLEAHGVEPEDISCVVLTHLHPDHVGGALLEEDGFWQLAFPAAEYVIQRAEWDYARIRPHKPPLEPLLRLLERSDQLRLVEGSMALNAHLELELTGGHTPGHQAIWVHGRDGSALLAGDVLASLSQFGRRFRAKYDTDPERAYAWRTALTKRLRDRAGTVVLFYHGLHPTAIRVFPQAGTEGAYWEEVTL